MRFLLALLLWLSASASVTIAAAPAPFAWNGWQFHERNLPKLEEAMRRAPDYRVNFVVFSHELFRPVERFLADAAWVHDINRAAAAAKANRLPFYLWIHELNEIPSEFQQDGKVKLDDPKLPAYLDDRYERLLKAVPGCAGFVLTFHETGHPVFRNSKVISQRTVPERIAFVSDIVNRVCQRHGMKLMVRNFFYEPREMEWFEEAMRLLPPEVIVMRKDMTHEFDPFYPFDPMHGKSGRQEIIEIDLGVEKALGFDGPYAQVEFIKRAVLRTRDTKSHGMMGRARLVWDRPFADVHEVNLYAFARFMADPTLEPAAVLRDWAARHYPAEAVPHIAAALRRTEFIHHHARYHLGWWFTKYIGEDWDSYAYYFSRPRVRSNAKWTGKPEDIEMEKLLYRPTPELFRRLVAEKDQVLREVRAGAAEVELAAAYLTAEQAREWREGFRFLDDAATLQREWVRAYFAHRIYVQTDDVNFRAIALDALQRLEELDRDPSRPWGRTSDSRHRYFIDKFVLELRWRMTNRAGALREDAWILEDAQRQLNVNAN